MPFPDAQELMAYWAKYPPPHLVLGKILANDQSKSAGGQQTTADAAFEASGNVLKFSQIPRYARDFVLEHHGRQRRS